MGAGMSKKQFNNRVYKTLKRIQARLIKEGVPTCYENFQLFPDNTYDDRDIAFNISFRRLDASNGETAGLLTVRLQVEANPIEKFTNLEDGIKRIIEVIAMPVPKNTVEILTKLRHVISYLSSAETVSDRLGSLSIVADAFHEIEGNRPKHQPDFYVQNEGSIFILHALSDAAKQWVAEHIPEDATFWGTDGVVVEHRYIADIVGGIQRDGLTVE